MRGVLKKIVGAAFHGVYRVMAVFVKALDRVVPWHKFPRWLGVFTLVVFREDLRKHNLHDTSKIDATEGSHDPRTSGWQPAFRSCRTADGTFNDLTDPAMGSGCTRFGRNVPLDHARVDPDLLKPNPREISLKLMTRDRFIPAETLNMLAAAWIQFQVHDWGNHERSETEHIPVELKEHDPWPERPMRVQRTRHDRTRPSTPGSCTPTFLNTETHWWDASQIYASRAEDQKKLRSFEDGKLDLVDDGRLKPEVPDRHGNRREGIDMTGFNDNWWVGLSLLHTLFSLEHNAICDRLKAAYPQWDDENLFQTARLINAALIAKIHTLEWTPAILGHPALQIGMSANWWGILGERFGKTFGRVSELEEISGIVGSPQDHHGVPYALTEEFVSVYRMHPLIPDDVRFYDSRTDDLVLERPFTKIQGNFTRAVIDEVGMRNALYSFGVTHPGAITLHNFPRALQRLERIDKTLLDVAVVDILRDRERGVPRYNQFRRLLRMEPVKSFEALTDNPDWARELKEVYDNDIEKVDLMVGLLAEPLPKGFGFSDTAFRIFILMASRRLKSDRFFTDDYTPEVYTQLGLDWINENNMKTVIQRHFPELTPAIQPVKNAFAPWTRADTVVSRPAPPVTWTWRARLTWSLRKWLWDGVVKVKHRLNRPLTIKAPKPAAKRIEPVPFVDRFPGIPVEHVRVAEHVPADEFSLIKHLFYTVQVWLYSLFSPMQAGLPPVDPDPREALRRAYGKGHRKYFPPPALPPEYEGSPDLGRLAVAGPYSIYLEAAPEADRYQWDLRELGRFEHRPGLYNLGVRVLFEVDPARRRLRPVSIESELGTSRPGEATWGLAVKLALCAATTHLSLVRHFNWVHLAGGAQLAIATRNALSHEHPLCRLLWAHVYGTQMSNDIVTRGQMARGGDFETVFSFTRRGMLDLFGATYLRHRFVVNDPRKDAERRKILDRGFELPSQKNLEALFDVIHEHAGDYLGIYYSSDGELRGDEALREWLDTLEQYVPGGVKEVLNGEVSRASVARLVAACIYLTTVQHDLLGTFLWNYQLWIHRQPVRVYRDGRREPLDVYQRLVNANFNLNVRRKKLLDQDLNNLALDERGKSALRTFRERLELLEREMRQEPWAVWKMYPEMLEVNINA